MATASRNCRRLTSSPAARWARPRLRVCTRRIFHATAPAPCARSRSQPNRALQYLIFISYAEIYNELIFDLLVPAGKSEWTARWSYGLSAPFKQLTSSRFTPVADKERTSKKLRTDKNKNVYISGASFSSLSTLGLPWPWSVWPWSVWPGLDMTPLGRPLCLSTDLREIQISSVEEAFRILSYGRRNRRMAATRLNKDSSRR